MYYAMGAQVDHTLNYHFEYVESVFFVERARVFEHCKEISLLTELPDNVHVVGCLAEVVSPYNIGMVELFEGTQLVVEEGTIDFSFERGEFDDFDSKLLIAVKVAA